MDLSNQVSIGLVWQKTLNVGHYTQTFQPNILYLPALIGTIGFCHFIPLSVTNLLGRKVGTELHFLTHFSN